MEEKMITQEVLEKFDKSGFNGFLDTEIIDIFLSLSSRSKKPNGISKKLIKEKQCLSGILESDHKDLVSYGVDPMASFTLRLVQEISRRYLREKAIAKPYCRSSREVFDYLFHSLRGLKKEVFMVLFLDPKNQIVKEKILFEGTIDSSAVYPREVIKEALACNATSMIFVHNHPSGEPEPSLCDKEITRGLVLAAQLMQMKVLDHIIIGNNCYFSFTDKGLIEDFNLSFLNLNI
jgi:DNA repair protein RadC